MGQDHRAVLFRHLAVTGQEHTQSRAGSVHHIGKIQLQMSDALQFTHDLFTGGIRGVHIQALRHETNQFSFAFIFDFHIRC